MNAPELLPALFKMIAALAVTLGVIIMTAYGFKKAMKKRTGGITDGELINILASKYLGPKNSILLIEVLGNILLIGIASGNISLLTELKDNELLEKFNSARDKKVKTIPFAHHLKKALFRRRP
jgi:flagellar protein FliO/FliZ